MHFQSTSPQYIVSRVAHFILRLEWVWIAVMILAFWHLSPPIRDRYVFLLGFALPIYGARWIVHRRLFTRTPLDALLIIFVFLTLYNFYDAPVSRAHYLVLVCRPFLGIFIIWYFADHVRQHGHLRYLILATIFLGNLIGGLALVASQWSASDKSDLFAFVIDTLPVLDYRQVMPDMQLSFNPNEIAGALAYLCPFLLAIAIGSFITDTPETPDRLNGVVNRLIRWGAIIGFLLTWTALFLGQSRFALGGVFIGLLIVIVVVLPNWKYRLFGLSIWGLFLILEILIVTNVLPLDLSSTTPAPDSGNPTATLDERDERTLTARFDLWERALRMVRDYPLTGAGMSTYRALVMQEEYMIPLYEGRRFGPPHAHNAFFQLGADLGVMGLALFVGWYGVTGWMAFQTYRLQNLNSKMMTTAITSGILSYMGYGIGDTITLWDRFAFLHWWFIALVVGVYILNKYDPSPLISNN